MQADKTAIVDIDGETSLTYGELRDRSAEQEAHLSRIGLSHGGRVAVIATKSADVIATFIGASRLGVTYVPLDTAASPGYWKMVLADLGIEHVLSNAPALHDTLNGVQIHNLDCDPTQAAAAEKAKDASAQRSLNDDAYVLTTSGSTGRPKGVLLSHRNAGAFANWAADEVGLDNNDTVLSVAPFHFDLSVFDIYSTLGRGGKLVLTPALATMFPGTLIEVLEAQKVTTLYTVPTLLRSLMDAGAFANPTRLSIRTIIYAGEPYPVAALCELMTALPDVTFRNFFGPTETNVSLAHRFSSIPHPGAEIPIGRPASEARITLVDDAGEEVVPGEVGEITVTGPTVMKGYLKAEGFEPARQPLATGDFAMQGPDGSFYFRGRKDHQVKVRGNRIELAAVENALLRDGGITDAAAVIVDDTLVAIVAANTPHDEQKLRACCVEQLPPGAVPHRFITVASLPRLSNHKLDILHLKALASEQG